MKSPKRPSSEGAAKYFHFTGLVKRLMANPTRGVKMMLRKNDHSSPIFLFFPIFSETTSARIYQRVKMMLNHMMFMIPGF